MALYIFTSEEWLNSLQSLLFILWEDFTFLATYFACLIARISWYNSCKHKLHIDCTMYMQALPGMCTNWSDGFQRIFLSNPKSVVFFFLETTKNSTCVL